MISEKGDVEQFKMHYKKPLEKIEVTIQKRMQHCEWRQKTNKQKNNTKQKQIKKTKRTKTKTKKTNKHKRKEKTKKDKNQKTFAEAVGKIKS